MATGMDNELIQDFLTEAGELIEQLDGDLVVLESEPATPGLLDQIFRALHTIKGAASFLGLTELIEFAHAAEDALNTLRKGEANVDQNVIDAMLHSVDVLRGQLAELADASPLTPGPPELIKQLQAIAAGGSSAGDQAIQTAETAAVQAADVAQAIGQPQDHDTEPTTPEQRGPFGGIITTLELPPEKADLTEFMADDITELAKSLAELAEPIRDPAQRQQSALKLTELGESTRATADFFGFRSLNTIAGMLANAGDHLGELKDDAITELAARLAATERLVHEIAHQLQAGDCIEWDLTTMAERFAATLAGENLDENARVAELNPEQALERDGLTETPALSSDTPGPSPEPEPEAQTDAPNDEPAGEPNEPAPSADPGSESRPASDAEAPAAKGGPPEQTIRVEVSRLEALLNLVGEMVLTKNQVLGHSRTLKDHPIPQDMIESVASIAGDLDRLTGELQVGVMRTRMQPLSKLFGRYPRIIRDLARKTGKQVDLVIEGGDTEVDKSVLEQLGDPLVHMLRNSVDHGLEPPDQRTESGKNSTGTIRLTAEHQGGHVRVAIADDGRGIDREVIANKAVEKGITTPEALPQLTDSEVFKFIFAPGFSTAKEVSDLSGRGVGMDVVRTNIAKLGGQVNVASTLGKGTTMEVLIPLTVAIMPAMMVGVGESEYAIPIMSIHEIVRPDEDEVESIAQRPAIRLRDEVLPLIDLRGVLGEPIPENRGGFAVVVGVGEEKAGLVVDRLGGQQEIVVKPLDDEYTNGGVFSGATIREDGDVSLILDIVKILRGQDAAQEKNTA